MKYPIEVSNEILARVLADLGTESLARSDAVAWARAVLDAHGSIQPGAFSFGRENNDFTHTWRIAYDAEVHESRYPSLGPPYGYRLSDFTEWAARLRCVDPPPSDRDLFPIRPHQCLRVFSQIPTCGVGVPFSKISDSLGDAVRRTEDGLGVIDEYLLGSTWGTRYLLQSCVLVKSSGYFDVTLPYHAVRETAIEKLLSTLQLPMEAVHYY